MQIKINLATKTYINHRMVRTIIIASVILLLIVSAWSLVCVLQNIKKLNRLQIDISALETRFNNRPSGIPEEQYRRMQADIRLYNGIIENKTRNWLGMIDRVEKATPAGIAITTLAPDIKNGEIKLEGYALSFAKVRDYLDKLEDSGSFKTVQLNSHQESDLNKVAKGIQFSITLKLAKP